MRDKWFGESFERKVDAEVVKRLTESIILVEGEMKRVLKKRSYPPPSQPGQPPAQRTAYLSISPTRVVDASEMAAYAGTPLEYGAHLELGTKDIDPRPWARLAFDNMKSRIKRIFGS